MTVGRQRLLLVLAAVIIILLLILLYFVWQKPQGGGSGGVSIDFDLPDLGGELPSGDESIAMDDPGLWEALPGLIELPEIPQ